MLRSESRARQLADDGDLTAQVVARRVQAAARQMHHRHRILHRHQLFAAGLDVAVGAAQRRQDQRGLPVYQVAAVELRRDLHRQRATAQRGLGDLGVGRGGDEVAAHADEHLGSAVAHGADRVDGVIARAVRGLVMPNCVSSAARNASGIFSQMPIVRSPCTLECPRTGHTPGAGLADHAAHQQQVGGLADGGHRVPVLGQSHRPAEHRALRGDQHLRHALQLLARQCRWPRRRCRGRRRGSGARTRRSPRSAAR